MDRARILDTVLRVDLSLAAASDLPRVLQLAIGGDDHIPHTRVHLSCVAHADARLSGQQGDFSGVHSTQLRSVDGKFRRSACARSRAAHAGITGGLVNAELIRTRHHFELIGPDAPTDLHPPRNDVCVIRGAGIHAVAGDRNHAALDTKALQISAVHDRRAGRDRRSIGIDEATTVASHTRWIGNHDLGALPGDFHITAQQAWVV